MPCLYGLRSLPDELVALVFSFLPHADLKSIALGSRWLNGHASDWLWKSVVLEDCRRRYTPADGEIPTPYYDEHDDTPIIQKLYILAANPVLASKVKSVTHRCQLPTPSLFNNLPFVFHDSPTLSADHRLLCLLKLAITNLKNVHTLRIICGHKNITKLLLEAFFHPSRPQTVQRLWLESSSLLDCAVDFKAAVEQVESLRLRRIRAEIAEDTISGVTQLVYPEHRLVRYGVGFLTDDHAGGSISVPAERGSLDHLPESAHRRRLLRTDSEATRERVQQYDKTIWGRLAHIERFLDVHSEALESIQQQHAPNVPSPMPIMNLVESSPRLTRLNLDWVMWRRVTGHDNGSGASTLNTLAKARFPSLRAFQVRNAAVDMTYLPSDIFLLQDPLLAFMEAHVNIQCLAFPLDRIYPPRTDNAGISARARHVVANLGRTLVELRLDAYFDDDHQDDIVDDTPVISLERISRRKFIEDFAPQLTDIATIKIEGSIPRDEKREILRALHLSPIKKLVIIGAAFPIGNTWGDRGRLLKSIDTELPDEAYQELRGEDDLLQPISAEGPALENLSSCSFDPSYGWPVSPPFLHTIAEYHASTIEELKICGFNGCPVLSHFKDMPQTAAILQPLTYFHKLRQLTMSFWFMSFFEDSYRDLEIMRFWTDRCTASSTAISLVEQEDTDASNAWALKLENEYAPSALAQRVADHIAPFIPIKAKNRPGGVMVRASFCLGRSDFQSYPSHIFDLDIKIGERDQVLTFEGPRNEQERKRWWDKLESRRWF